MDIRKHFVAIIVMVFVTTASLAQPGGGGNPGGGPPVPISGIELLFLAGGAFGFWKLKTRNNVK